MKLKELNKVERKEGKRRKRGREAGSQYLIHPTSRPALPTMAASTHMWIFKFKGKLTKTEFQKFSSFIMLAQFAVLSSLRLVAPYWSMQTQNISITAEISIRQHCPMTDSYRRTISCASEVMGLKKEMSTPYLRKREL